MYPYPLDPPEWCEACAQELARGRHYCPADEWAVPEPDSDLIPANHMQQDTIEEAS